MVQPSWRSRPLRLAILSMAGTMLTGCAFVPKSRLDDCHKLSRTLEADKARLNDMVLSQRSQYSDLAQRADDDARRLRVQTDENRQLRASVQAYQDERDQLAADFARIKNLLQASANPVSTSMLRRFEEFSKGRPGCEFDSVSGVLTLSTDSLFEPGGDELKPSAQPTITALANLLADPAASDLRMLVAGHTDDSPVRRAGFEPGEGEQEQEPSQGHLSLDRATRVRDRLALEANIDPARMEVAGFESSVPLTDTTDDPARAKNRRIEIRLFGTPGESAAAATDP